MELDDIRQMLHLIDKFVEENNLPMLIQHFPISEKEKRHITIARQTMINDKIRFELKSFAFKE